MTAQIFVDILNHAFFLPHQLNLLVFDECHAAVKDAPMKQVLSKLQNCESKYVISQFFTYASYMTNYNRVH